MIKLSPCYSYGSKFAIGNILGTIDLILISKKPTRHQPSAPKIFSPKEISPKEYWPKGQFLAIRKSMLRINFNSK